LKISGKQLSGLMIKTSPALENLSPFLPQVEKAEGVQQGFHREKGLMSRNNKNYQGFQQALLLLFTLSI